jgi:hypothetical protein
MLPQLKEFNVSISEGDTPQFSISLEKEAIAVNIIDEHVISDVVDMNLIKSLVKEVELAKKKSVVTHPLMPVHIKYKGKPVMTITPDGKKKIHITSAAHLGVKVFFFKLADSLQELSVHK